MTNSDDESKIRNVMREGVLVLAASAAGRACMTMERDGGERVMANLKRIKDNAAIMLTMIDALFEQDDGTQ
jgi:hypothetical protein